MPGRAGSRYVLSTSIVDGMRRTAHMSIESLGEFEHQVLLTALRLAPDAYSGAIVLELAERAGREASPAAVYIALRRLERKGLVTSEMRLAEGPEGERTRRYFEVTADGLRVLRDSRRRYQRLWEGLDLLVEEGS